MVIKIGVHQSNEWHLAMDRVTDNVYGSVTDVGCYHVRSLTLTVKLVLKGMFAPLYRIKYTNIANID